MKNAEKNPDLTSAGIPTKSAMSEVEVESEHNPSVSGADVTTCPKLIRSATFAPGHGAIFPAKMKYASSLQVPWMVPSMRWHHD